MYAYTRTYTHICIYMNSLYKYIYLPNKLVFASYHATRTGRRTRHDRDWTIHRARSWTYDARKGIVVLGTSQHHRDRAAHTRATGQRSCPGRANKHHTVHARCQQRASRQRKESSSQCCHLTQSEKRLAVTAAETWCNAQQNVCQRHPVNMCAALGNEHESAQGVLRQAWERHGI